MIEHRQQLFFLLEALTQAHDLAEREFSQCFLPDDLDEILAVLGQVIGSHQVERRQRVADEILADRHRPAHGLFIDLKAVFFGKWRDICP